jgi:hypothetical protein
MTNKQWLSVAAISILVSGCAGLVYEGGYAHKDGWRPGTIISIGNAPEYLEKLADACSSSKNGGTYAMVRYTGNSHLRWRAYPLVPNSTLRVDDRVHINIMECNLVPMPKQE